MMMPKQSNLLDGIRQTIKLSKREQEVIYHMIDGLTAKQIARSINISHRTVETYLDRIKSKLNCRNKYEIIIKILFYINKSGFL